MDLCVLSLSSGLVCVCARASVRRRRLWIFPSERDNTTKMLFSLPRVFVAVVVALVSSGMAAPTAAPTALTTPTSLDDRIKELEVNVTELALPIKAAGVSAKVSR